MVMVIVLLVEIEINHVTSKEKIHTVDPVNSTNQFISWKNVKINISLCTYTNHTFLLFLCLQQLLPTYLDLNN